MRNGGDGNLTTLDGVLMAETTLAEGGSAMWRQLVSAFAVASVLVLGAAGPVVAGGWAVTTIDALPEGGFQAGTTYRVGYTIRQHGQHPFAGANTEIRITSPSTGERASFAGVPDGPVGHYVAEVQFPSTGVWDWEVSQHPFGPQTLGSIRVVEPGPASTDLTAQGASSLLAALPGAAEWDVRSSGWLALVLPSATVLVVALFALRLMTVVRRRRAGPRLPTGAPVGAAR